MTQPTIAIPCADPAPQEPFRLSTDEDHPQEHEDAPAARSPLGSRVASLVAIVTPLAGLLAAFVLLWGDGFSWLYLALLVGGYIITGLGITVGYHRLFTHRSFETGRIVTAVLGILGSMAVQGPIIRWAATHRRHHHHSDRHEDPHSPNTHGGGLAARIRGFWHSHLGWLLCTGAPELHRYVPDLRADPLIRRLDAFSPLWILAGMAIPAAIGFAATGAWEGAFLGFLWGGLVRVFVVHHITWSINSACHIWGARPYRSHDHSRNNVVFGIFGLGEGWHNNHHAFPTSARHGLAWWQFDLSYAVIRALTVLGLARNVKTPSPERKAAKLAA